MAITAAEMCAEHAIEVLEAALFLSTITFFMSKFRICALIWSALNE